MKVLCIALGLAAETGRFAVYPSVAQSGDDVKGVSTIWRIDGDNRCPVADVYWLDYEAIAKSTLIPSNPLARVFTLGLTTVAALLIWLKAFLIWFAAFFRPLFRRLPGGSKLLRRLPGRPKPITQMLQLFICFVIMLVLVAYFVVAVVALVQLILAAYGNATGTAALTIRWPQIFVIIGTVLGILLPGIRGQLSSAAEDYLTMMRYLWVAGPRNSLRGEVLTLIEHAGKRPEINCISIVGFSFGSLVAIDTVFPASQPPTVRMEEVKCLATIGCPFDVVRMLQRRYFQDRFPPANPEVDWINIYDPIDLLGSNFRDDTEQDTADQGVEIMRSEDVVKRAFAGSDPGESDPRSAAGSADQGTGSLDFGGEEQPSSADSPHQGPAAEESAKAPKPNKSWNPSERLDFVKILLLASLKVHSQYWGPNPDGDTALRLLVIELFGGTWVLR
jgi:hypothetical protein